MKLLSIFLAVRGFVLQTLSYRFGWLKEIIIHFRPLEFPLLDVIAEVSFEI